MQRVSVIGAGPGGCLAAILLARAGLAVTLIERDEFPRDKVCGECVSAMGLATLQRAGLMERLSSLGPEVLLATELAGMSGVSVRHELKKPMWGISRRVLDSALVEAAREVGVRVMQPVRAERLERGEGQGWRVWVRDRERGVDEVAADLVVVADGSSALMEGGRPAATGDLGVKAHFVGVRADERAREAIHLFTLPGFYGGLAKVEGELWNVAMSVPEEKVREARGDLEKVWQECLEKSVWLEGMMRGAERVTGWLASGLPRFGVRRDWPERVVPVGNAAAALEPIGGEGMGLALRSAELGAEGIVRAVRERSEVDTARLRKEYERLWRRRRTVCRAAAMGLSRPAVARGMVGLSGWLPGVTRAVLGAMGKRAVR